MLIEINSLSLNRINGGSNIKSGDFKTVFEYQLLDENSEIINTLDGNIAIIKMHRYGKIYYQTESVVTDGTVSFTIDSPIDPLIYFLEVEVDGYIFPSDNSAKIRVYESSVDNTNVSQQNNINIEKMIEDYLNKTSLEIDKEEDVKWNIAHNLNKIPTVIVLDDDNVMLHGYNVKYIDLNNIEINFGIPVSGKVILK